MFIEHLKIQNFRCFQAVALQPSPGINIITGDNASGKTSLLEAIYFLGRGESFRRTLARPVIRHGEKAFRVSASVRDNGGRTRRLIAYRDRSGMEYKLDGQTSTTRLDLVNALPLQLIDPNVHRLLEQGPRQRRHFLDWGVFHVEHVFFPAWQRYRRALRQRNRALKARWPKKDIIAWDAELVANAEIVDASRRAYIKHLSERLPERARNLLGDEPVSLDYACGWRGAEGYGAALAAHLAQDVRAGFTQQGPHRADLRVRIGGSNARDWVSRGQQKILTSALLLVQAHILRERRGVFPVLLVDDLASELGPRYRATLIDEIKKFGGQSFLTFLEPNLVPDAIPAASRFHVEPGRIEVLGSSAC